jgi:[acyl-carrier-protein] S-malonyltransferase
LLNETLGEISMTDAQIPLIANVNASIVKNSEEIKGLLVEQLYSPVLWEDSVRTMLDNGVTHFIECGPGKVLSGLIKKINRSATVLPVYDEESLEAVVEVSKGWSK